MPPNSSRSQAEHAAQTRLLYENANTGIAVTMIAAPVLAYFQLPAVRYEIVLGWLGYILLVSGARFVLSRHYWRASLSGTTTTGWNAAFAAGAGLAGAGWGAAGILLYPKADLMNQAFLVFVLGGMMLGGASLLGFPACFMPKVM